MCLRTYSASVRGTAVAHLPAAFHHDLLYSQVPSELTLFQLICYSSPRNLIHGTYRTQANFNVWNQIYSPESEAVEALRSLLELYQHCHGKLSPWRHVVDEHRGGAPCQIIPASLSPASQISAAQAWHWWWQALPLRAAYLSLKRTYQAFSILYNSPLRHARNLKWVSVENRNLLMHCCCHQFTEYAEKPLSNYPNIWVCS